METKVPAMRPWNATDDSTGSENRFLRFSPIEQDVDIPIIEHIDLGADIRENSEPGPLAPAPENEVRKGIADRLRARRVYLRFTQQEAADAIGIKRNTYAAYELGYNSIPSTDIPKIATILRCSIGYLYGEDEPKPEASEDMSDSIISMMVMRFFYTLPAPTRARAMRMLLERTVSDQAAPGIYGRFPKDQLRVYAEKYTIRQLIEQLEYEEKADQ